MIPMPVAKMTNPTIEPVREFPVCKERRLDERTSGPADVKAEDPENQEAGGQEIPREKRQEEDEKRHAGCNQRGSQQIHAAFASFLPGKDLQEKRNRDHGDQGNEEEVGPVECSRDEPAHHGPDAGGKCDRGGDGSEYLSPVRRGEVARNHNHDQRGYRGGAGALDGAGNDDGRIEGLEGKAQSGSRRVDEDADDDQPLEAEEIGKAAVDN